MDGTGRNAGSAVYAHSGIDIGGLVIGVKALHRTYRYAVGEAAEMTVVHHDMRHCTVSSCCRRRRTPARGASSQRAPRGCAARGADACDLDEIAAIRLAPAASPQQSHALR